MTTVMVVGSASVAEAGKSCPPGSHRGNGPDVDKIYCYDNETGELVKVVPK